MVKQNVKVIVRTRPTARFAEQNFKINVESQSIDLHLPKSESGGPINNQQEHFHFKFDQILHNASQEKVFEDAARDIIGGVLEGYNGTILAYGQTGAGKTFTMAGGMSNFKYRGLVPRSICNVFHEIQNRPELAITVRCSMVEIYNELLFDLLTTNAIAEQDGELAIQEDKHGAISVKGLALRVAASEEEALNIFFEGDTNRAVAAHSLNASSSRSHCIFTIHLETRSRVESTEKVYFVSDDDTAHCCG
jgi:kinesin family protein 6/9